MSERDPRLAPFDALIGTWDTEGRHVEFDGVVTGRVTYEWLEGGHFVVQRSHNDHELFPDAISVIGPTEDGDGVAMEYFDSRGVRRTYAVTGEQGVLRMVREQPGFDQRFTLSPGGDTFEFLAELARTPGDWREDMRVIYRRVA